MLFLLGFVMLRLSSFLLAASTLVFSTAWALKPHPFIQGGLGLSTTSIKHMFGDFCTHSREGYGTLDDGPNLDGHIIIGARFAEKRFFVSPYAEVRLNAYNQKFTVPLVSEATFYGRGPRLQYSTHPFFHITAKPSFYTFGFGAYIGYTFDALKPYLRLGLASQNIGYEFSHGLTRYTADKMMHSFCWGVGATYDLTPNLSLDMALLTSNKVQKATALQHKSGEVAPGKIETAPFRRVSTDFSVGLRYTFGG
ncbi:outer membrane protein [Candidatus Hepatobacter penaei]|uniref:outer membrane protein n=1 Tax=Candidatus Hepatobacter penaei TaxID=1274402 RepID=UPI0012E09CB9|nr:hypothetical protein [Candidatus Hepatobacter penaei]